LASYPELSLPPRILRPRSSQTSPPSPFFGAYTKKSSESNLTRPAQNTSFSKYLPFIFPTPCREILKFSFSNPLSD